MKTSPALDKAIDDLKKAPRTWLVTGAAGFIGSHLAEFLVSIGQNVRGLDNFSNGRKENLLAIGRNMGAKAHLFNFVEGDICDEKLCLSLMEGVDIVLHHAALGSVPRSIANPRATNQSNVAGFLNVITTAKECGIKRFVYASSSSVYGDNTDLPKTESKIGRPLSPYAITKVTNELYAKTFSDLYAIETIGLRYFNVFGARQLPNGPYAAVIPRWIQALLHGNEAQIFGDGSTSRDFCYVKNVIQMNVLAATTTNPNAVNRVYNTACNHKTSLNDIFYLIRELLGKYYPDLLAREPQYGPQRKGDIHHSQADITAASEALGYQPLYDVGAGLAETVDAQVEEFKSASRSVESSPESSPKNSKDNHTGPAYRAEMH